MILSIQEVLERDLIRNRDFAGGEGLVEPEGAAIDIRLGEIWQMQPESEAFLGKTTRKTKEYTKVAEFKAGQSDWFTLEPNVYYQFKSVEEVVSPEDAVGKFVPRFNLLSCGILILGTKADPGYKGQFVVPVVNLSGVPFKIELGARFAQFEFHRIDGESVQYRGQWQGGRVFTPEEEVQV